MPKNKIKKAGELQEKVLLAGLCLRGYNIVCTIFKKSKYFVLLNGWKQCIRLIGCVAINEALEGSP